MGSMPVLKRLWGLPHPFPPYEHTVRGIPPGRGPSPDYGGTLISEFQAPELGEGNFCCFSAAHFVIFFLLLLQQLKWTNTMDKAPTNQQLA